MSTAEPRKLPSGLTPEEEARNAAEREEIRRQLAELPRSTAPEPRRAVDENGRLLPLPENYLEIQAKNLREMFEEWDKMPDDDPPGAYEAALRGIDEERRRLGMRTLFDGHFES